MVDKPFLVSGPSGNVLFPYFNARVNEPADSKSKWKSDDPHTLRFHEESSKTVDRGREKLTKKKASSKARYFRLWALAPENWKEGTLQELRKQGTKRAVQIHMHRKRRRSLTWVYLPLCPE